MHNRRLYYGNIILPASFDRSPVAVERQQTVATHSEAAAAEILVKENDLSNDSSKRITNKEV